MQWLTQWLRPTPKRLYLDYAAATPLSTQVLRAMQPYFVEQFGNASAIHAEGQAAARAVGAAREQIARTIGVRSEEVFFTGSGTEANNLAILGYIEYLHAAGRAYEEMEVISTAIEHPSVLEALRILEMKGVKVHSAPVSETGVIDVAAVGKLLSSQTVLLTYAYVNSEIGTIQPVKRLARTVRAYMKEHDTVIAMHLDAAQAPLWVSCQLHRLGVDMLSLDAGKCNGPKGVGILVKRSSIKVQSLVVGGGQEAGLRAGTENTAGIVGAAVALREAQTAHEAVAVRVSAERDALIAALRSIPGVYLNGPDGEERVANNCNISLVGCDSEFAVVVLDAAGIAASTKSACSGAGGGGSTVVMATTGDAARATSTIRFTLGPETYLQATDIERICHVLRSHQTRMQRFDSSAN